MYFTCIPHTQQVRNPFIRGGGGHSRGKMDSRQAALIRMGVGVGGDSVDSKSYLVSHLHVHVSDALGIKKIIDKHQLISGEAYSVVRHADTCQIQAYVHVDNTATIQDQYSN